MLILGGLVALAALWLTGLTSGVIVGAGPRGEGCRLFWGEAVDGVAWSASGDRLLVRTRTAEGLDDGFVGIRVFRWPGMDLVSQVNPWYGTGESIADVTSSFSPGLTLSTRGVLAGPTARDRWRSNQLCVLDEAGLSAKAGP